ncbi:E3 ubiquitin-protein ligase TRIM45-like [Saccostrea echinata]|uniref:E3 ubiquitin-protein ligase TRIM45-like n=1 Tax=Saccostrea echinata TaxID=191078 RepID=UPI002A82A4BA|nr:E3 ubiquitin-protein ligase TRIM45-like [Saccostrea echinata]
MFGYQHKRTKQVSAFAQHYIECANCEEQPAQYLCKTCPGNLCVDCKRDHMRRKISKNHTVVPLTADETRKLIFPNCVEHKERKLECYCTVCKAPVCMECMMGAHNGHKVDNLEMVFEKIRHYREKAKEEVESLLPCYQRMLLEEEKKKTELNNNTDIIQKQIEKHADRIVQTVMKIKTKAIKNLECDKQDALKRMKTTQKILYDRTECLKQIYADIKSRLTTKIGVEHFQEEKLSSIREMHTFPDRYTVSVKNLTPGNIDIISRIFGDIEHFVEVNAKGNYKQKIRITEEEAKKCALFGIHKKCEKSLECEDSNKHGKYTREKGSFGYRSRTMSF